MKQLLVLLLTLTTIYAQASDSNGTWTYAIAKKKFTQHFGTSLYGEFRTTDFVKQVDLGLAFISADCYINSWLTGSLSYGFLGKYKPSQIKEEKDAKYDSYWIPMSYVCATATARQDFGKWTLSLRELNQITHYNSKEIQGSCISTPGLEVEPIHVQGKTTNVLRSQLKINHNIGDFSPNTSIELYNNYEDFWTLDKMKLSIGAEYRLSKSTKIEVCYRFYQVRVPSITVEHVLGLGYILVI